MASDNVRLLDTVYEHWSRGDWTPRFEVYAPDFEWGWSEEFPDLGGVVSEDAATSDRLRQWLSGWEDWRVEAERFVASGDVVVAMTRYRGRGKTSGAAVDAEGAHLWTFRDGKVVRLVVYSSRDAALRAAGLADSGP
jgi:ketosteroid isomerase-like protein